MADETVPELLEDEFGYVSGRYTDLKDLTGLRKAFAIIDDATATRDGLEEAYDESPDAIKKQAKKGGYGDSESGVAEFINDKAAEAEALPKAKADVIHSYIRNLLEEFGLVESSEAD